jgi:hypothetical protein
MPDHDAVAAAYFVPPRRASERIQVADGADRIGKRRRRR